MLLIQTFQLNCNTFTLSSRRAVVSCKAKRSSLHEHLQAYMTTTVSYLGSSKILKCYNLAAIAAITDLLATDLGHSN